MSFIDKVFAGLFVVLVVFLVIGVSEEPRPTKSVEAEEQCDTKVCIADRNMGYAAGPCKRAIDNQSKYQSEWTTGVLTPIFDRYTINDETGVINYFGDKVRFQNGFGAFANMIYMCAFDPESKNVINVRIEEGRLN